MDDRHEDWIVSEFSAHGLVISKHIDVLLNDINFSELLPYLYAKKLVSEEEWLMPATSLGARSIMERVLGRLMKKESTEEEFIAFIQCLKDSSGHLPHKELAHTLEKIFLDEEEVTNTCETLGCLYSVSSTMYVTTYTPTCICHLLAVIRRYKTFLVP